MPLYDTFSLPEGDPVVNLAGILYEERVAMVMPIMLFPEMGKLLSKSNFRCFDPLNGSK